MVKRLEITSLLLWMPKFGCRFKAHDHRILGLLASDTPDVVPVGKVNILSPQLSKVLYINLLTKLHSRADRFFFFFWIAVYCVSVLAVKEHFRGSTGLPQVYKARLLPDRHRAPYNLWGWNKLSTPFPCSFAAFIQYISPSAFHEHMQNRL